MFYNYLKMLGLKSFICCLFLWFSIVSPGDFNGISSTIENKSELKISTNDTNHQALVVDNHLETNRADGSLKTFKIPYSFLNKTIKYPRHQTNNHTLLYVEIGDYVPLRLTSRAIIFPFHSFT